MQVKYSFLYPDLPKVAVYLSLKGTEFGTDIILTSLKKYKKNQTPEKLWKQRSYPFVRKSYIYNGISICKSVSLLYQEED